MSEWPVLFFPGDQGESAGVPGIAGPKGERGDPGFPGKLGLDCSIQEYKILETKQVGIAKLGCFCNPESEIWGACNLGGAQIGW